METKKCIFCETEFTRRENCRIKDWTKQKLCSKKCHFAWKKGKRASPKTEFKKGHNTWNKGIKYLQITGDKHPMWEGGRYEKDGYVFIRKPEHPYCSQIGYVRGHRLVMEKELGRYLTPKEVIHHINEIKDDNRIENLKLFESAGFHRAYHRWSLEKEKISIN